LGIWRDSLYDAAATGGVAASKKQAPRLRRMVRFANHSASRGMTDLVSALEGDELVVEAVWLDGFEQLAQ
jgi:hypothetical protein